MEQIYTEYALLDSKVKELTDKRDAMKEKVLEFMAEIGKDKDETSVGKFTITKLKTWTYTDSTLQIGEKFKAAKAKEESTGDATFVEKPSLRFTPIKL